jgi:hypothetical protein
LLPTSVGVPIQSGWTVWSPTSSLSFGLLINNMTKKEQEQRVLQELQYMIAEGMVVETSPGYYRLKTERELEEEMEALG